MPGADLDIVTPLAKRIGQALRQDPAQDEGDGGQGRAGRAQGLLRRPRRREDRNVRRDAGLGRPPPERGADRRRGGGRRRSTSAASFAVDRQMRTNVPHIFAIGDIVGQPMLAHKATHEGKVAAEVASGHKSSFDAKAIPSVAYTDPEVAWAGVTETEAKAKGDQIRQGGVPLGGERAVAFARPRRGPDQDAVGRGDPAPDRLRHRRAERRRSHLRGGAGDRDGRRRPRTSASPSTRTRRCRRPSPCRPRPSPGR